MKVLLLLLSALVAASYSSRERNNKQYRVVCYWGSWSFYLKNFRPEDSNPNICTHMIYGFAQLFPNNTIGSFEPNLDFGDTDWTTGLPYGEGAFRRFNYLRTVNPYLTTLLAIGGWSEGSDKYSKMVSNPSSRKVFVDSVIKFLKENDFDGLDLDWEYPSLKAKTEEDREPGNLADKENFVALIRELRDAFQPYGFLLTAAVSPGKNTIDTAYDVPQVNKYLDFINLMGYDFHVGKEEKVAHQSPLYPRPGDSELDRELTVQYAVDYWIKLGADPKKLVLGMPLYARGFYLANVATHAIGTPSYGDGGMPAYNEFCQQLKSGELQVYRDDIQKVPYAVWPAKRLWLGYDDVQSLKEKLTFLKSRGLGGAMVWAIDTDDFRGNCGNGKFPLLKTISRELNGIDGPDVIIPETHVTPNGNPTGTPTGAPPTAPPQTIPPITAEPTQRPGGSFQCPGVGYYADPNNKTIFHQCIDDNKGGYQDLVVHCPGGLTFDQSARVCT